MVSEGREESLKRIVNLLYLFLENEFYNMDNSYVGTILNKCILFEYLDNFAQSLFTEPKKLSLYSTKALCSENNGYKLG